ncbi:MAG: sigma-70 family RNA polymerase sigma factor [Acidimicrobiia bacterium]|nr:sigma-70 family RNA polymerase sigma factor [Acidimicrobiia bacterium]
METTLNQRTDAVLVQLVADRHEGALAEVYRRHGGPVFGLAKRLIRDTDLAQEIVQEVMLRLWNNPEKFDETRGSLRSYLLSHTHGRSVDLIRSESARRIREERDAKLAVETGLSLEEEVWEMALADHVRQALNELDEGERKAIELAYFGGYTYREVAKLLDTPEGTIKSRIRTGLQRLNGMLVKSGLAPTS